MGISQDQPEQSTSFASTKIFLDLIKGRRSVYDINDNMSRATNEQISTIVKEALNTCPSPWNISSSCCLILLGDHHKVLFNDIVLPTMHDALPAETWEKMEPKLSGLTAGYGTILFFENTEVWDKLVENNPRSKPMAGPWSNVTSGMLQYTVWTALSIAGFGASLQHYDSNEKIVEQIDSRFEVPKSWSLRAELVFGNKTKEPGEIPHNPMATLDERCRILS